MRSFREKNKQTFEERIPICSSRVCLILGRYWRMFPLTRKIEDCAMFNPSVCLVSLEAALFWQLSLAFLIESGLFLAFNYEENPTTPFKFICQPIPLQDIYFFLARRRDFSARAANNVMWIPGSSKNVSSTATAPMDTSAKRSLGMIRRSLSNVVAHNNRREQHPILSTRRTLLWAVPRAGSNSSGGKRRYINIVQKKE